MRNSNVINTMLRRYQRDYCIAKFSMPLLKIIGIVSGILCLGFMGYIENGGELTTAMWIKIAASFIVPVLCFQLHEKMDILKTVSKNGYRYCLRYKKSKILKARATRAAACAQKAA